MTSLNTMLIMIHNKLDSHSLKQHHENTNVNKKKQIQLREHINHLYNKIPPVYKNNASPDIFLRNS